MGTSKNVKLGACDVSFKGANLGYTQGNVSVSFTAEQKDVEVDQEDTPIDSYFTSQTFEVTVPLAEYQLGLLKEVFPGATLVIDGCTYQGIYNSETSYATNDAVLYDTKFYKALVAVTSDDPDTVDTTDWSEIAASVSKKLELSASSGISLLSVAGELVVHPLSAGDSNNEDITVYSAAPSPSISYSYDKENARVVEVTFKALRDSSAAGWVAFGDLTASAAT